MRDSNRPWPGRRRRSRARDLTRLDPSARRAERWWAPPTGVQARFASWYELFRTSAPKGRTAGPPTATFGDVIVADFSAADCPRSRRWASTWCYLPPIHPIRPHRGASGPDQCPGLSQGWANPGKPLGHRGTSTVATTAIPCRARHTIERLLSGRCWGKGGTAREEGEPRPRRWALDLAIQCSPRSPLGCAERNPEYGFYRRPDGLDQKYAGREESATKKISQEHLSPSTSSMRSPGKSLWGMRCLGLWSCTGSATQGSSGTFRVDNPHNQGHSTSGSGSHRTGCRRAIPRWVLLAGGRLTRPLPPEGRCDAALAKNRIFQPVVYLLYNGVYRSRRTRKSPPYFEELTPVRRMAEKFKLPWQPLPEQPPLTSCRRSCSRRRPAGPSGCRAAPRGTTLGGALGAYLQRLRASCARPRRVPGTEEYPHSEKYREIRQREPGRGGPGQSHRTISPDPLNDIHAARTRPLSSCPRAISASTRGGPPSRALLRQDDAEPGHNVVLVRGEPRSLRRARGPSSASRWTAIGIAPERDL